MTNGWQKLDRVTEFWVCSSLLIGEQRTVITRCDLHLDSQESANFDPFMWFRIVFVELRESLDTEL
jgi:hypothetical protein